MAISIEVLNTKNEKTGTVELSDKVFESKTSLAVVHEVVNALLANRRHGTHSTKTRGEVSGGGLKPWKQKHTGRARSGSTRSPLWRHGGIIFGPKPRKYTQTVSKDKRNMALRRVLSDFAKEGRLGIVDAFSVDKAKTKAAAEIVKKMGWPEKSILVVEQIDDVLGKATRNLAQVRLCRAQDLNSYTALTAEKLIFTRASLDQITKRLEK